MTRRTPPLETDDGEQARRKCLRLLTTRPRARGELHGALARAGFAEEVIAEVLSGLERAGLVNDQEFARAWAASRLASGSGKDKLRWELQQRGISEQVIEETLGHLADQEGELVGALLFAERRARGRRDPKTLARVQRLLFGRGFDRETVEAVMERLSAGGAQSS